MREAARIGRRGGDGPSARPRLLARRDGALRARTLRLLVGACVAVWMLGACLPALAQAEEEGIHKIKHVVMIMQENRSFDEYFGTYPGAHGIPGSVCVPDPQNGGCIKPYHDPHDENHGGPHGTAAFEGDIDGGLMDGFVGQAEATKKCRGGTDPECTPCKPQGEAEARAARPAGACNDVMGYHDAREIPNYWTYAKDFALQDNLFEAASAWSLTEHLYLVSAWSARCPAGDTKPLDCKNSLAPKSGSQSWDGPNVEGKATYAWTDITYLMDKAHVSWRYYVSKGNEPDCEGDEELSCKSVKQSAQTPGIWNPLQGFTDVEEDGQKQNIEGLNSFYEAAHQSEECGLPNVSWIVPNLEHSEHPPSLISKGQAYVTTLINTIMKSPCWGSTAIFLSWDDPGGFYDHVNPPNVDVNGYGLRVPGLVISPYSKSGYIDHQQLSHDAYLKFIEDDFLAGNRLNPKTDGRADKRIDVREEAPGLGNIANDFNFNQAPRAPVTLPTHPEPGPASNPPGPSPPTVVTMNALPGGSSAATLNATVNPNGETVSACRFEYGSSLPYAKSAPCTPSPGKGESAVAVAAQVSGLTPNTTYHFRISATNAGGTAVGDDETFQTGESLPERGRCLPASGPGGYTNATCTAPSEPGKGAFAWLPGAGASKFTLQGGALTLETAHKTTIACTSVSGSGEYTGPKTELLQLTLTGCEEPGHGECHDEKQTAGEIVLSPLGGELGQIAPATTAKKPKPPSIGSSLHSSDGQSAVAAFACGTAANQVSVNGSAIAVATPVDAMTRTSALTLSGRRGKQTPEAFEGGAGDALLVSLNGAAGERAGLNVTLTATAEEALEIKALG